MWLSNHKDQPKEITDPSKSEIQSKKANPPQGSKEQGREPKPQ
jgi:hypothetical protein